MNTIFDMCRKNLHDRLNIHEHDGRSANDVYIEIKRMQDALDVAINICKPRLIMGGIRYGKLGWEHKNLMNYMQKKFDLYKSSGNSEFLYDLINFVAIETVLKTHPNYHFEATDRK